MNHPLDPLGQQWGSMSALEKIEWMVETDGFAVEPVAPDATTEPPQPGYTYTIGFPAHADFPDVAVFGLTPVAARGLIGLIADLRRGGTELPVDAELVGLLDNDLRCRFAPIDVADRGTMFATAAAWYGNQPIEMVQLIYPDRNGWLPYEPGFDPHLRYAQPVVGTIG